MYPIRELSSTLSGSRMCGSLLPPQKLLLLQLLYFFIVKTSRLHNPLLYAVLDVCKSSLPGMLPRRISLKLIPRSPGSAQAHEFVNLIGLKTCPLCAFCLCARGMRLHPWRHDDARQRCLPGRCYHTGGEWPFLWLFMSGAFKIEFVAPGRISARCLVATAGSVMVKHVKAFPRVASSMHALDGVCTYFWRSGTTQIWGIMLQPPKPLKSSCMEETLTSKHHKSCVCTGPSNAKRVQGFVLTREKSRAGRTQTL